MKSESNDIFSIPNFEGPLDLLWHLIQRDEIEIYEVSLHSIIEQFVRKKIGVEIKLEKGAEFIGLAAMLLWYKSRALLPRHEQKEQLVEEETDPHFEVIHQLIDYCRFKQAAKTFAEMEQKQSIFYSRGAEETEVKKSLGINHLSLEDLALLFRQILNKASAARGVIEEEMWLVADKIREIRALIKSEMQISFISLFHPGRVKQELIVFFLALLELMKEEEVRVVSLNSGEVFIQPKHLA